MEEIFEDPITCETMEEASMLPCGHSASRATLIACIERSHRCPICKAEATLEDITPNYILRHAIETFKHEQKKQRDMLQLGNPAAAAAAAQATDVQQQVVASVTRQPTSPIRVHEISPAQLDEAPKVLSEAMFDDPWVSYIFPNDRWTRKQRADAQEWFFSMMLQYGAKYGRIWVTSNSAGKVLGVAIWQPPYESGVSIWRMLKVGAAQAIIRLGANSSIRMKTVLDASEAAHSKEMKNVNHWSLYCVGVHPQDQNRGYGSMLLKPVLDQAVETGNEVYLDTPSARAIPFFTRLGFRVAKSVEPTVFPRFVLMRK